MKQENKYPNLIPNSERSPDELREMGRKGGIKSGESRRRKRELQQFARMFWEALDDLEKQGVDTSILYEILSKIS